MPYNENNEEQNDTSVHNESTDPHEESNDESNPADDYRKKAEELEKMVGSLKRELKQYKKTDEAPAEKKEEAKAPQGYDATEISRLYLATENIKDEAEQDIVIEYAQKFGISPREALKDVGAQAKLEDYRRKQSVKEATPTVSGGAPTSNKGIDYYVKKVLDGGKLPSDPEMADKVQEALAKQSKNRRYRG